MNKVKDALTRKFGPLPAWAWLGVLTVGIWYYRNRLSAGSATVQGTGTGSIAPGPGIQPLEPNQSYYDPADPGTFFTTPNTTTSTGGAGHTGRKHKKTKRSRTHVLKSRGKPKKVGAHRTKGIKLPGRRQKAGVTPRTHRPRQRPDTDHDRRRDRRKTKVATPGKSRPAENYAVARAPEPTHHAAPRHAAPARTTHHRRTVKK